MKLGQNGIVSFSIRLAVFQASGGARVKLHKIRCRSKKYLTAELAEYAEIIQFFFSAFSAISAVNSYVSFLIRLAAFQDSGGACMKHLTNAEVGMGNTEGWSRCALSL